MNRLIHYFMMFFFSLVLLRPVPAEADNAIEYLSAFNDDNTITFEAIGRFPDGDKSHVRFFIDADNDPRTGYSHRLIQGADYRIKDRKLYEFDDGEWVRIRVSVTTSKQDNYIASEVPLSFLNLSGTINFIAVVMDSHWHNWAIYPEMVSYDPGDQPGPGGTDNFSDSVLEAKLQYQKIEGSPKFIGFIGNFGEDNSIDNFSLSSEGYLTFEIHEWYDVKSKRIELRDPNEWKINSSTRIRMEGEVKFARPEGDIDEITWMQLHHKHSGAKPFVRLVWKERKAGHTDGLWAVIRAGDNQRAEWLYLGERPDTFFPSMISIQGKKLTIVVADRQYSQNIPPYWQDKRNYFKAGLYCSGRSAYKTRDARVQFKVLNIMY